MPAIVGNCCGALEVLDRGLQPVEGADPSDWGATIAELHSDVKRRRHHSEAGREHARQARWDIAAQQHWEVYRD